MNFGRIRRGPMAADAFTQIRNTLFRDNRLSFRDKGVFGLISTHRDGFGVSAESIAACSPTDGITAIKTSLRNLESYGYLQRTRLRNTNGTLGGAVYFITDQPEAFGDVPELQNPSSQPAVAQPPLAEPTQAEPTVAEPAVVSPTVAELPHKKTNSKHTSRKKTSSSRLPGPRPVPDPASEPEEEGPSNGNDVNRARLFLMTLPGPWALGSADATRIAPQLATAVASLGLAYNDHLTGQIATNDFGINNFASVIETKRIPNLRAPAAGGAKLPPACQPCLDENPHAQHNARWRTRGGQLCPICHPDARRAAA